jgi:hypothetical protein
MSVRVFAQTKYSEVEGFLQGDLSKQQLVSELWKDQGSEETMNFMRGIVPIKKGLLRNGITRNITPQGFTVGPTASYGKAVDQGTRAHDIFPSKAHVLHWFGPDGKSIFATHVRHPGTKGRFFIKQTKETMKTVLKQLYLTIWREHN